MKLHLDQNTQAFTLLKSWYYEYLLSKIKQLNKPNTKILNEFPKNKLDNKLKNFEIALKFATPKKIQKIPKKSSIKKTVVKKMLKPVKLECCCKKQDGECVGSRHNKCCSQVGRFYVFVLASKD